MMIHRSRRGWSLTGTPSSVKCDFFDILVSLTLFDVRTVCLGKDFLDTLAFPLTGGVDVQQSCEGWRGIEQRDWRGDGVASANVWPAHHPEDGHILVGFGAVAVVVAAVVALDQHGAVGRQAGEEGAERRIDGGDLVDVAFRHPTVVVPGTIDGAEVDEGEVELVGDELAGCFDGDDLVAIGLVGGACVKRVGETAGPTDVA